MTRDADNKRKSALNVRPGVTAAQDGPTSPAAPRRRTLSAEQYVAGVLSGDRTLLARAITLIESNAAAHQELAQEVLTALLPQRGESIRVGITGVPGAGKSTFIEALGGQLTTAGHKVAVLAVDPSSSVTGGSILGDKTRMEKLAADPNAFIRPSPSGGTLGGVARKTRESIVLFEAAGYDVILVETVGVGQSEIQVRSMVDFFLLVLLAGAGDDLQGIKKGVVEIADAIMINKADGPGRQAAELAQAEFNRVLHYLRPATEGWTTRAHLCSALKGEGVADIWRVVTTYLAHTRQSGGFATRRADQEEQWVHNLISEGLADRLAAREEVMAARNDLLARVRAGELPATSAATRLLDLFFRSVGGDN